MMNAIAWISQNLSGLDWYAWVILPVLIFVARVCDVTLGTLRIIFISRGKRSIAPLLGFFEVLIWIVVIGQLVQHIQSVTAYIGYAAGFAAGNFVGLWLEDRMALGTLVLRVIVPQDGETLAQRLHEAGFGVTSVDGRGATEAVKLIYTVVKRRHAHQVMAIIHDTTPNAFVSVEDVRATEKGVFPLSAMRKGDTFFGRKSK